MLGSRDDFDSVDFPGSFVLRLHGCAAHLLDNLVLIDKGLAAKAKLLGQSSQLGSLRLGQWHLDGEDLLNRHTWD